MDTGPRLGRPGRAWSPRALAGPVIAPHPHPRTRHVGQRQAPLRPRTALPAGAPRSWSPMPRAYPSPNHTQSSEQSRRVATETCMPSLRLSPFYAPGGLRISVPRPSRPADTPLRPSGPSRQPEVSASLCPRAELSRFLRRSEYLQMPWLPDITIIKWVDSLGEFSQGLR